MNKNTTTIKELRAQAKAKGIKGYSKMTKDELINAVRIPSFDMEAVKRQRELIDAAKISPPKTMGWLKELGAAIASNPKVWGRKTLLFVASYDIKDIRGNVLAKKGELCFTTKTLKAYMRGWLARYLARTNQQGKADEETLASMYSKLMEANVITVGVDPTWSGSYIGRATSTADDLLKEVSEYYGVAPKHHDSEITFETGSVGDAHASSTVSMDKIERVGVELSKITAGDYENKTLAEFANESPI